MKDPQLWCSIFPVFAGMVPLGLVDKFGEDNFPRIRGDGPLDGSQMVSTYQFSPYSRGWSE